MMLDTQEWRLFMETVSLSLSPSGQHENEEERK